MKATHQPRQFTIVAAVACFVVLVLVAHRAALHQISATDPRALAQILLVARGILLSIGLSVAVLAYYWKSLRTLALVEAGDDAQSLLDAAEYSRRNVLWFIHLRWVAVAAVLGLITIARGPSLAPLVGWWVALVAANIAFELWVVRAETFDRQILVQAILDLVVLTGFLNASGGLENPLYTVFLFHVIVGRILLPSNRAMAVTLTSASLFCLLACGEYLQILPHYTNFFFPHEGAGEPTVAAVNTAAHDHVGAVHASHDLFYVLGRTIPFLAVLLLTDYFMARVIARLRSSETHLQSVARRAFLERERLEGVIDASGIGMMQVTPGTTVSWHSARVARWFGWKPKEVDETCPLLDSGCDTCVVQEVVASGRVAATERRVALRGGGDRYFRHSASPVCDPNGHVTQVVEVIQDVTEQRELEAEALRAGKLSVLGRLAAGIAHEIGNPLASLATRLSLLERRNQNAAFVAQSVTILRAQIERISRIVYGVSQFARTQRRDRTLWELNDVLEETIEILKLDTRAKHIRFETDLEKPSPIVFGIRDQISQIALNLVLNAVEAMPAGGRVFVSSETRGNEAIFTVRDEGPGVPDDVLPHLFEPFFSTKEKGTGLGLSICYGLAAAQGGRIEVASTSAVGAAFSVTLPLEGNPVTIPEDASRSNVRETEK